MQTYLKTKPVWAQLLLFLGVTAVSFFIGSSIGIVILSKMTGVESTVLLDSKTWKSNDSGIITFIRGMILIQFLFLFVLPSHIFAHLSDRRPMEYLGLKAPNSALYWILAILLIMVAYPLAEYFGYINQKIPIGGSAEKWMKGMEEEATRQIQFMLAKHTPMELVKNLVFISLFAGIGEELFFRGILQRLLIRITKNPWIGIILAAAIFSFFHFQFYGFLPRMFLGILLGAIYWYSGSLWLAMLAHFLYDAAVIVWIYLDPKILQNPDATILKGQEFQLLIAAMISLALTFVILRQMQKRSVTSYEAIYNDDLPKKDGFSF